MERVKPEIQETITQRLRLFIEQAGNVTAFARSIGVSRDSVNNWLSGKSDIRLNDLVKISEQYHVSIDWLLGLAESPTRDGDQQKAETYTGLSAEAVERLHSLKGHDSISLDYLSETIDNDQFLEIISSLDHLVLSYNRSVKAINYLLDYENRESHTLCHDLLDAEEELATYFPDMRMQLFELSEKWSDFMESFIPTKELISDGKRLHQKYVLGE